MKTFRTDLSVDGIDALISKIRQYQGTFYNDFLAAVRQICDDAAEIAQDAFGMAVKVEVESIATKNDQYIARFAIVGSNKAVAFLEFGAGLLTDEDHPFADDAPFPVEKGSYSKINAHEYEAWTYWWFNHKKYTFVAPRRGLFKASEYIKDNLREEIRNSIR